MYEVKNVKSSSLTPLVSVRFIYTFFLNVYKGSQECLKHTTRLIVGSLDRLFFLVGQFSVYTSYTLDLSFRESVVGEVRNSLTLFTVHVPRPQPSPLT